MAKIKSHHEGVVGLTVLLIMSVVMTVGLAVATQSVSQQRQSRQEEDSEKALNLAEAGIEQLLSQDLNSSPSLSGLPGVGFDVQMQAVLSDVFISSGHAIDIDLTGNSNPVQIDWTSGGVCTGAAIIIAVLDSSNNIKRGAFDPCNSGSRNNNSFQSASYSGGVASVVINNGNLLSAGSDLKMRIKPVYADTQVSVSGGGTLPNQSFLVTTTASLTDGTSRTVQVQRSLPMMPSIFDYVLFSGLSI